MSSAPLSPSNFGNAELGFLYVISHANAPGMIKIGITQRPQARMEELGADIVFARVLCFEPRRHEQRLHLKYGDLRLPGTEWFRLCSGREDGAQADPRFSELLQEVYEIGSEVLSLCIHRPDMSLPDQLAWMRDVNNRNIVSHSVQMAEKTEALESAQVELRQLRERVAVLEAQLEELHRRIPR